MDLAYVMGILSIVLVVVMNVQGIMYGINHTKKRGK